MNPIYYQISMIKERGRTTLGNLKLIPNQVTGVRLVMTAILWGMFVLGMNEYLGIGLIICFISDVLDGQLARRLRQATVFGAKFDSLADNILIPSALVWLIFETEIYVNHSVLLSLAIAVYLFSLIIERIRSRGVHVSQLYLSKLSGLMLYIFGIYTFITGRFSAGLFYLTMGIFFLSSLESLILRFSRVEVNQHLTSILFTSGIFTRSKVHPLNSNLTGRIFSFLYGAQPSAPKDRE